MLTAPPVGRAGQPRPLAWPPASCWCPLRGWGRGLARGLLWARLGGGSWEGFHWRGGLDLHLQGTDPLLLHQTDEGDAHFAGGPGPDDQGLAGAKSQVAPDTQLHKALPRSLAGALGPPALCPVAGPAAPSEPSDLQPLLGSRQDRRSASSPSLWAAANSPLLCCGHCLRVSVLLPPLVPRVPVHSAELSPQLPTSPVSPRGPGFAGSQPSWTCPCLACPPHCGVHCIPARDLPHPV